MRFHQLSFLLLTFFSPYFAFAHFFLKIPAYIGYDDTLQATAPCGGFSATARPVVTNFTVNGFPVGITSTHNGVTYEFRAALLSAPTTWVSLTPTCQVTSGGYPYFCEPQIPGVAAWAGQDAILQVIQHASDGTLYQCAAIKFVTGGPYTGYTTTQCRNSTSPATNAVWV
ncbi:hypothetical protein TWF569_008819 [Orbilia oligospora]|uniref:Copper acquisition factor BIM1-like domain-containing protein n=1 Tax=Orbilia oligospora TaxID=2813651 RepID=A0A7C8KE85_ORBOL|nr:hypothetical protein TWF706_001140 [Orbilia oligospora]KAF3138322.1 hypothetical protein TWF569_008819 [Orbilia oligospora]KAF3168957.1 hypothetical protein TWF225_011454 [Orbilia oligospora]KAF3170839.1 hypothetical protein TWF751_006665 [Orbilia oligospora]KAF3246751.1 hypothetical protein TWF128_008867 [Orbilia oligospora]